MTGKQRARLRAMANTLETILYIGKDGIGENTIRETEDALEARELVKISVLDNSDEDPREAGEAIAAATGSEVVAVIGRKIILFRESSKPEKRAISTLL